VHGANGNIHAEWFTSQGLEFKQYFLRSLLWQGLTNDFIDYPENRIKRTL